jgi:SAM-dependent methyltransferase
MVITGETSTAPPPDRLLGHLERVRLFEFDTVKRLFPADARVLEIGGGSGFQARMIATHGCQVESVDLADRPHFIEPFFPVRDYDGRVFPFPDASFDIVFSSNVLEHVPHLEAMLLEIKRVLKPGGVAIHILPSASWRLWTCVTHYLAIAREVIRRLAGSKSAAGRQSQSASATAAAPPRRSLATRLLNILIPERHGEYANAFSELWYFSKMRWRRVFTGSGYELQEVYGNGLFYTGFIICPSLSFRLRQALSRVIGSSGSVFVMKAR